MGSVNVYYNPEKLGLTILAQIEYSISCYSFDTRVVWKDKEGFLYTARDSGCSCPTPFEDYTKIENLERVDIDSLKREVKKEALDLKEGQDFIEKVESALN